jgi:hypothetical protein
MSNAAIVARIEELIQLLENGDISCKVFGRQFEAHFPALENVEYRHILAARSASSAMEVVDAFGDEGLFALNSVSDVVAWARDWLRAIPQ